MEEDLNYVIFLFCSWSLRLSLDIWDSNELICGLKKVFFKILMNQALKCQYILYPVTKHPRKKILEYFQQICPPFFRLIPLMTPANLQNKKNSIKRQIFFWHSTVELHEAQCQHNTFIKKKNNNFSLTHWFHNLDKNAWLLIFPLI